MFCNKCGANLPDGSAFCSVCGQSFANNQNAAPQAQQPQYQQPQYQQPQYQQPQYQAPQYQQPQYQQPGYNPAPAAPVQGMGWYKFLIYFSLFAGAVLNVITGIVSMSGSQYGGGYYTKAVYSYFDGLQGFDIFYGILLFALAAFGIYVRFRLSGYKSNGPKMLNVLYIAAAVVSLVYVIGVSIIVEGDVELSYASSVGSIIGAVIMIAINSVYFKKRAHLFIY